jgi:hypothetical protein
MSTEGELEGYKIAAGAWLDTVYLLRDQNVHNMIALLAMADVLAGQALTGYGQGWGGEVPTRLLIERMEERIAEWRAGTFAHGLRRQPITRREAAVEGYDIAAGAWTDTVFRLVDQNINNPLALTAMADVLAAEALLCYGTDFGGEECARDFIQQIEKRIDEWKRGEFAQEVEYRARPNA